MHAPEPIWLEPGDTATAAENWLTQTRLAPPCALPRPLLVLMYHGIHDSRSDDGHFDPRYSVTSEAFEQQMALLAHLRDQQTAPLARLPKLLAATPTNGPDRSELAASVLISFDDGDVSNAERALPCLRRHDLRAVFFVTTDNLGQPGWLSMNQLRQLGDADMTLGSHGTTHRFLNGLSMDELRGELAGSRKLLAGISGRNIDWLALPGGRGGPREAQVARDLGYQFVFGSEPGINSPPQRTEVLQRVAITRDTDLAAFTQILSWHGAAVRRLRWRHRLLALPKRLLGDRGFDRLRSALLR